MLLRALFSIFGLLFFSADAARVEIITQSPQQGSMIVGRLIGEAELYFDESRLNVSSTGYFVFGVGRDASSQVDLVVKDPVARKFTVNIQARQWAIERVDGLPPSKVSPQAPEVLQRIKLEAQQVSKARANNSTLSFFATDFILPAAGRISGVYGSQRVLNGEPKNPHYGLDVANKVGTPVLAAASGQVSLVHADMFYSGGTLIIDHGHGVSSTYIHLNSIDVKVGDLVEQGQRVATIGMTGRATGPHLDWRLNWFNTRLDPQLLISAPKSLKQNSQETL